MDIGILRIPIFVEIFFLANIHVTQAGNQINCVLKRFNSLFDNQTSLSKFLSRGRVKTELREHDRAQRTRENQLFREPRALERAGARDGGRGGGLEGERTGRHSFVCDSLLCTLYNQGFLLLLNVTRSIEILVRWSVDSVAK